MEPSTSTGVQKFKIVLLGEGAVGKTSLMLRFIENKFNSKHVSTLQASFLIKKMNIFGNRVELNVWDTAGQERFHALGPIYYRDSQGAVLVYDITDSQSFEKVKMWVKELRRMLGDNVELVIVGNKIDKDNERNVQSHVALQYAESVGAIYLETSAKTGTGIEAVFLQLAKKMIERAKTSNTSSNETRSSTLGGGLLISEDSHNEIPRKKCC